MITTAWGHRTRVRTFVRRIVAHQRGARPVPVREEARSEEE